MYYIFGDSHAKCFLNLFPNNVYSYPASSAKGLHNTHSKSGVNNKIIDIIASLPEESNIIMFFGKVDLDFITNYKYNTTKIEDYKEYIISTVYSYIEFIKSNTLNKNVYICELPITHIDDTSMLKILCNEIHSKNINSHLSNNEQCLYSNFSKVIPYNERVNLYKIFNTELENQCKINNFLFIEINKYFINNSGDFEIPRKYINKNTLDHHLLPNIVELYMDSLNKFNYTKE